VDTAVTAPVHPSQGSVRTMTVEEGHVLNIDGSTNSNKYKQGDRSMSAVSRGSAFHVTSDVEDGGGGGGGPHADRVSVLSGASGRSKTTSQLEAAKLPWYKGITCKDIKDITPTVLILLIGLLIMIFVIPYAFSSVIKQLEAEQIIEAAREAKKIADFEARKKAAEEAAARAAEAAAESTTAAEAIETTLLNT